VLGVGLVVAAGVGAERSGARSHSEPPPAGDEPRESEHLLAIETPR